MAFFGCVIHLNKTRICILLILLSILLILYKIQNKPANPITNKLPSELSLEYTNENGDINLKYLLAAAINAAETGGKLIVATKDNLQIQSKGKTLGVENSVTTADFLSHCAMLQTISKPFPSVKIVSEEETEECDSNLLNKYDVSNFNFNIELFNNEFVAEDDITVWIDPLDATLEYTEKLYEYVTNMVCVAIKGKPTIGVIHDPFTKTTYWAWIEHGKSRNLDFKDSVRDGNSKPYKVIISRSHAGPVKQVLGDKIVDKVEMVIAAGAGYKALKVASGEVDAYIHVTNIMKWDTCAGNAIINALGGVYTTKHNFTTSYVKDNKNSMEGVVASIKHHELFISKIKN